MSKGIYPTQEPDQVPAAAVQEIVTNLKQLHDLGRPTDDQAVESRIEQYFSFCQRSSIRPGIESLCVALHVSRETLNRWGHGIGCSRRRQETVEAAKAFITAALEQMALCGRLSPPTAIFLLKNWASYRDVVSVENEPAVSRDLEPELTPEQVLDQLEQDIPID